MKKYLPWDEYQAKIRKLEDIKFMDNSTLDSIKNLGNCIVAGINKNWIQRLF